MKISVPIPVLLQKGFERKFLNYKLHPSRNKSYQPSAVRLEVALADSHMLARRYNLYIFFASTVQVDILVCVLNTENLPLHFSTPVVETKNR
jgi:uncharacterized membrane protein